MSIDLLREYSDDIWMNEIFPSMSLKQIVDLKKSKLLDEYISLNEDKFIKFSEPMNINMLYNFFNLLLKDSVIYYKEDIIIKKSDWSNLNIENINISDEESNEYKKYYEHETIINWDFDFKPDYIIRNHNDVLDYLSRNLIKNEKISINILTYKDYQYEYTNTSIFIYINKSETNFDKLYKIFEEMEDGMFGLGNYEIYNRFEDKKIDKNRGRLEPLTDGIIVKFNLMSSY